VDLLTEIKKQKESGATIKVIVRGQTDTFGDVTLTALAPIESFEGVQPVEQNAATIVARLVYKNFSALLTGDLEIPLEEQLVAKTDLPLESTILKVGHHGSAGSTSEAFLDAVKPKAALISVGKKNRYGHPTKRVLDLLQLKNIPTYRTDEQGRVEVVSDGEGYEIKTER
jgi:competence protein ComEC